MNVLTPKLAADLSLKLFPDSEPVEALFSVADWFNEYLDERNALNGNSDTHQKSAPIVRSPSPPPLSPTGRQITRSWSAPETSEPEPEPAAQQYSLTGSGVYDDPEVKPMMTALLNHARANRIAATKLQKDIGVSYPTVLNWLRGKMPRGENIDKIRTYLAKHVR